MQTFIPRRNQPCTSCVSTGCRYLPPGRPGSASAVPRISSNWIIEWLVIMTSSLRYGSKIAAPSSEETRDQRCQATGVPAKAPLSQSPFQLESPRTLAKISLGRNPGFTTFRRTIWIWILAYRSRIVGSTKMTIWWCKETDSTFPIQTLWWVRAWLGTTAPIIAMAPVRWLVDTVPRYHQLIPVLITWICVWDPTILVLTTLRYDK